MKEKDIEKKTLLFYFSSFTMSKQATSVMRQLLILFFFFNYSDVCLQKELISKHMYCKKEKHRPCSSFYCEWKFLLCL